MFQWKISIWSLSPFLHRANEPHKGFWMMGFFGCCRDGGSLQTASVLGLGSRMTKPGFQGWNVQRQPQPTRRGEVIEIKSPAIGDWIQWITPMYWNLPKSSYTSGFRKFHVDEPAEFAERAETWREHGGSEQTAHTLPYLALCATPISGSELY